MAAAKVILANESVRAAACWLGAQFIRAVFAAGRWRVENEDIARGCLAGGKPFILCFWHGRLMMMPKIWTLQRPIHMLISRHRDGRIISRTVSHFGIRTVAGSSSKGGMAALRAMLKILGAGDCVGVTPDGPRGPRMRASMGVINAARLAQVPIVPASFSASSRRVLPSWDRFIVALPLGKGVIAWGPPIMVARDADEAALEMARRALEDGLNNLTRALDARFDYAAIEPEPFPVQTIMGGDR